ncbi:Csu type fimbrial protein [Vibrio parahaemolyticus]|uniref:Protein CsuA n=1 Tax=Vibrio parahaemolyticus TaxID=670 RepID=A0AAX0M735_VIBPH|nr:spore coat U domain-containing protein [Vibrio parahaemolyticus]OQS96171.1 protein CsuA [Vibrio parahaemolyticus O4:K12 str. K1203]QGG34764.1 SCPU domain-containing protein [Vibrio parahaemolyticus 10329]ASZ50385.1 SCPU domain-containing protein [Vibrio parahaemolyticus]AUT90016.1 SCPU domain-containing protein [Vibrio parahaemolyticus]AYO06639.1 SCPU domain-containing protein [Vibrio parahaemolyticus]
MELYMKRIYLMMPLLLTSFSWQANSASVSGTIDVSINLVQGCVINGNNAVDTASGIGFGLLDFGDVPAIFTEQDAVVNGGSATGIEVLCSNGVTPTFTLGTGLYDGSVAAGSYAMSNGSEYIEYKLFTDSDRNTQIVQNGTVALNEFTTATAQTIELFAKAYGTSSTAGSYSDTISVTLSW